MSPRMVIAGVLRGRRSADNAAGSVLETSVGRPVSVRVPGEGVAPSGTARVAPLAGPLTQRPVGVDQRTAAAMLLTAVEGLPLGAADDALVARATDRWDPADTAILASLIGRARVEGPTRWVQSQAATPDGFVPVCSGCRRRPITGLVGLEEAQALARVHDVVHHDGAWTCEVVPVGGGSR